MAQQQTQAKNDWRALYQLSRQQRQKFTDRADFYEPADLVINPVTRRAGGRKFDDSEPTFAGVPGLFIATEDFEMIETVGGEMTQSNIMTQNRFYCHIRQPVDTNWTIIVRSSYDTHALLGIPQQVQGEPKVMPSRPRMPAGDQKVYLKPGEV